MAATTDFAGASTEMKRRHQCVRFRRSLSVPFALSLLLLVTNSNLCDAAQRRFTIADEIRSSRFVGHWEQEPDVVYSPNGRYFVVQTERGLLDENRPESTIRIFRVDDVRSFLVQPDLTGTSPSPFWAISKATSKNGP